MARQQNLGDPARDEALLIGALAGTLTVVVLGAWAALRTAAWWDHTPPPPARPADLAHALADHRVAWGTTATTAAALLGAVAAALIVLGARVATRGRAARARCDHAVAHLARRADLRPLRAVARRAGAGRLGLPAELATSHPGLPLGAALLPPHGKRQAEVFASWEDTVVIIAGPRTGKTTAFAIPMLLAAPGAAVATSNKRDLVDATAALRARDGRRVWTFDPQHITGRPAPGPDGQDATWWWDPLSYLTGPGGELDPARATRLAGQLVTSTTPAGARSDAYFDTAKTDLIALLLLAAAAAGTAVPVVWSWLADPVDPTPIRALAAAGFPLHEQALHALAGLPERQREGVYGSARAVMGFLLDPAVAGWITPTPHREGFNPRTFATGADTLYLLSRDANGGAAPIVAALTVAVTDALEEHATTCPGGRLPVPFVAVLDEAANICRIRDLDGLYSHYGSRGIVLVTILQNWAQGAQAWGEAGMEKLWSAANFRLYAGGVDDDDYLRRLSALIGAHREIHHAHTNSSGGRTTTRSHVQRDTLTPADLRELPTGRAVAFASGTPAFLLAPRPWWTGPHAEAVRTTLTTQASPGGEVPAPRTPATAARAGDRP